MDEKDIAQANEDMESLLQSLETIRHDSGGYTLLPKNHPNLIGHGETALVVELTRQKIAKIVSYEEDEQHKGQYILVGGYVGASPHSIEETVIALREMGFNNVLDHVAVNRYPEFKHGKDHAITPYGYHISLDLREGGKYKVFSIEEFPFGELENGQALIAQMEESLVRIKASLGSGEYMLSVDRHATKDKPDEALKRMFIGRVNSQTNQGELFFADLDHCVIQKTF